MPPEGRPEKKWVQKLDPGFFVSGFGGGVGGGGVFRVSMGIRPWNAKSMGIVSYADP